MVLCEIQSNFNFLGSWLALTISGILTVFIVSGLPFYFQYMNVTYDTWRRKSIPWYPEPFWVRDEILQTVKCVATATLCPAAALWMSQNGYSEGYCGVEPHGWGWLFCQWMLIWIGTDVYEWAYHRFGHVTEIGWNNHKAHHRFGNPTPFAVIADEFVDQFIRAMPLFIFPLLFPTNIDLMFGEFMALFYVYGTLVHSGHEYDWLDTHNWHINTPFQHCLHHAKSTVGADKTYHTGFFFKYWDRAVGALYDKKCFCAQCEEKAGLRTREHFAKVKIVDYSPLFDWRFWIEGKNYRYKNKGKTEFAKVTNEGAQ